MPSNIAPHDDKLTDLKDLKSRIWITYKCRVLAHERVSKYNFHSQVLSILYTLPIIFISIVDLIIPVDSKASLITVFFSLSVLVASVFIYSQNFSGKVENIKENYLKLQNIYDILNIENYDEISKEYHNILSSYDNHKEIDYLHLIRQLNEKGESDERHSKYLKNNLSLIRIHKYKYAITLLVLYFIPASSITYTVCIIFTQC